MSSDDPRLLAARSELGYTSTPALAMTNEPEAVSEREQWRLTGEGWARDAERLRDEWEPLRRQGEAFVEALVQSPFSSRFRDEIRTFRRSLDWMTKKL